MTQELDREIAKVENTFLGVEDHGILTATIGFTGNNGSWGQGTPGYGLDAYNGDRAKKKPAPQYPQDRVGTAFGMEFIRRLLQAFGVNQWEDIKGRTVFVVREGGRFGTIVGIEPLPTEGGKAFMFKELEDLADKGV